jgi:hypothetical protein
MFHNIKMIDYRKPLRERLESRKHCGPYIWEPAKVGNGRCFYQGKGFEMDRHGSSFRLRIEEANEYLDSRINGYYADNFQDTVMVPIIARLPHSRGFLAGWTMGSGMLASIDATIYDEPKDAAMAAHSMAEYDAERNRDYEEEEE